MTNINLEREADPATQIGSLLFGYAERRMAQARRDGRRFVHYTSAEAAISIIEKGEVWLRNSSVMNDYSEIAHGELCLRYIFYGDNETKARSEQVLELVQPGLHAAVAAAFEESAGQRRAYTYLISISEHGDPNPRPGLVDPEETYGRLSMWRAYGSGGGVAFVFNQEPFFSPSNVLNAFTSPVFYGNPNDFGMEWERMLAGVEQNIDLIRQMEPNAFFNTLSLAVHFASLTTKHPGFSEEREWRITYSPSPADEHMDDDSFNRSSPLGREFRTINGLPQRIYKLPMRDYPEDGFTGATLPAMLNKVIIGPTQYPMVIADTLHMALSRAGVENVADKLIASHIPLRT